VGEELTGTVEYARFAARREWQSRGRTITSGRCHDAPVDATSRSAARLLWRGVVGAVAATIAFLPGVAAALGPPEITAPTQDQRLATMGPEVSWVSEADAGSYLVTAVTPATPPGGEPLSGCQPSSTAGITLPFRGDGTYSVTVTAFADATCAANGQASPARTFTLATRPTLRVGRRRAHVSSQVRPDRLRITATAVAQTAYFDVQAAPGARLGAAGGIIHPRLSGRVTPNARGVPLTTVQFGSPGTWTLVIRPVSSGGVAGPWSAPVRVLVRSPFLLTNVGVRPTPRTTRIAFAGRVRFATGGRLTLLESFRGGSFAPVRSLRIGRTGGFSIVHRARHGVGRYRYRLRFSGHGLVDAGISDVIFAGTVRLLPG
jgi:hypothetical protein